MSVHLVEDMFNMHDHYGVHKVMETLDAEKLRMFLKFRIDFLQEELDEMIKAYNENLWAQMSDYQAPIEDSIYLIKGLHARWVFMLKNMEPSDYQKTFVHPETMRTITLESNLALYAWHCDHHLAHIHLALGR